MKRFLFYCLVTAGLIGCSTSGSDMDQIFPSKFDGWRAGKSQHYDPANLYDCIDGEAELYLSYGFQRLSTLEYTQENSDHFLSADLYDMGSLINAFGLYSNYRAPEHETADIGTEAIVSEYGIRFFKNRYVAEVRASDRDSLGQEGMRKLALEMASAISDAGGWPQVLNLLPEERLVDKTTRYVAKEMLNQSFLPGGLEARYSLSGGEVTAFFIFFDTESDARKGLLSLREFYGSGDETSFPSELGDESYVIVTPYQGVMRICRSRETLFGIWDLTDPAAAEPLMHNLSSSMQSKTLDKSTISSQK